MAKKTKRDKIKINNKIKALFDGRGFDEAVDFFEDKILIELTSLLEIRSINLRHKEMVRSLRIFWNEATYEQRYTTLKFLEKNYKNHTPTEETLFTKREFILSLLDDVNHTPYEAGLIVNSFIDSKNQKITKERVLNKLSYIRIQQKLNRFEQNLGVSFNNEYQMELYHSYTFKLPNETFSKLLLTITESISHKELDLLDDEEQIKYLNILKVTAIEKKQRNIDRYIAFLSKPHPYLSLENMVRLIKLMPPEDDLLEIEISRDILNDIFHKLNPKYRLRVINDEIIIEKNRGVNLYGVHLEYQLALPYDRKYIYHSIWYGKELNIADDVYDFDEENKEHFYLTLKEMEDELVEMSENLHISIEKIREFIFEFVEIGIQATKSLSIRDKTKRKVLFHFSEYMRPIQEKRRKEELLAKSIRDFKALFPMARAMKREIIFHVGATNSGKTYTALEHLKSASTGIYLAPLRLLALEGYEKLRDSGIRVSLITGEEEMIDDESTHIASTIEMMNSSIDIDVCVIDEIQMIADRDRGWAWANALIGVPAKKIILTGSSDALGVIEELARYLDEPLSVVEFERKNPLIMNAHATSLQNIEKGSAIVAFSRRDVLALKQQLSSHYSVSVVYGNLSPEVRREEARRFREGESDVLVATDAIAFGLNLPIKTLIFAKDNKFDGLRRRELNATEVKQIAGRAGRFGLLEVGYVGALESNALGLIAKLLDSKLNDLKLPVAIMASLEHILLISEILETQNLVTIFNFFVDNMEFEGPFVASNIESMLKLATLVNDYDLELVTKYILSCAPVSLESPYIESIFHRYIKELESGNVVNYIPPRDLPKFAQTNEMLLNAEDRVREISLYMWLSFKFPDNFVDIKKVNESKIRLNNFIEASLRQNVFIKKCSKCGVTLDFSYRFSICDKCHSKNHRRRY